MHYLSYQINQGQFFELHLEIVIQIMLQWRNDNAIQWVLFFNGSTRHLQLVHYRVHRGQPCKNNSTKKIIIHKVEIKLKNEQDHFLKIGTHFCLVRNKEHLKTINEN
jgi:hypothetical protein